VIAVLIGTAVIPNTSLAHQGYQTRVDELTLAISLDPHNEGLTLERAGFLLQLKRPVEAIADLDASQSLRSQLTWWSARGTALAQLGRHREVIKVMTRALPRFPKSAVLLRLRWRAHDALGNKKRAAEDCTRAAMLEPDPDDVAACATRLSPDRAVALLETALASRQAPMMRERLIDRLVSLRRYDRALEIVDGGGVTLVWRVRRGEVMHLSGDPEARSHLALTLVAVKQRQKKRPTALLKVLEARTLAALNRHAAATRLMQSVVKDNPNFRAGRTWLRRIQESPGATGPPYPQTTLPESALPDG
jgi:tetratricopeptide (TPR) repeat protein